MNAKDLGPSELQRPNSSPHLTAPEFSNRGAINRLPLLPESRIIWRLNNNGQQKPLQEQRKAFLSSLVAHDFNDRTKHSQHEHSLVQSIWKLVWSSVAWSKATEMCARGARHDAHQPFLGTKLSESYEPSNALFFLRKGKKAKDTLKRRSKCKYTLQLQLATRGSVTKRKPPGSDMQKYQTPHFPLSSGQNSPKQKSSGRNSVTFFICFFLNEKKGMGKT